MLNVSESRNPNNELFTPGQKSVYLSMELTFNCRQRVALVQRLPQTSARS